MIRALTLADIPQMVPIHIRNAAEWSHNAQMGEEHIANIYRVILDSKEGFGFGYFQGGEVASFITATTDYFATMKKLYTLVRWKHYGTILAQVLRHPGEFWDLWEAKFVLPRVLKNMGTTAFLLTWHNNFTQEDSSIAAVFVMQKTLATLKAKGFSTCTVQVDAHNERPNMYYQSLKAPLVFSSKHNKVYEVQTG